MNYLFIVDLDERGIFKCHIENQKSSRVVWQADNEEEEDGSFWPIECGYMKNTKDMDGLTEHLLDMGVIKSGATIKYMG